MLLICWLLDLNVELAPIIPTLDPPMLLLFDWVNWILLDLYAEFCKVIDDDGPTLVLGTRVYEYFFYCSISELVWKVAPPLVLTYTWLLLKWDGEIILDPYSV